MTEQAQRLDGRVMDTRRDSADFRDRIYQPALIRLQPMLLPLKKQIVVLDQGTEGACTGFGLAAMINYLNAGRGIQTRVSPRMLYEMARRHDRWPGEDYEGSSARGALKGWHKNGVCPDSAWPYDPQRPGYFTRGRQLQALQFPLGAYYRVLKKRSDVHAALHETGAVFATASVHAGWSRVGRDGVIPDTFKDRIEGGHAFCIVGYTGQGFIIQNSWGADWGGLTLGRERYAGLAVWKYADFDRNYWDGWVARMALPVESLEALSGGRISEGPGGAERVEKGPRRHEIAPYYIHIDDGRFDPKGDYPSSMEETRELVREAVEQSAGDGSRPPGHILLYAHGGLNTVKGSAARVGKWRDVFDANRIRQIHFIWETGLLASVKDLLLGKDEFAGKRAGGFSDWSDCWLEKAVQGVGYALWKEMTDDAHLAFKTAGQAGSLSLKTLHAAMKRLPPSKRPKLHMIGHSAGSIWLGHLIRRWFGLGGSPVESLQLFAPACTMEFYRKAFRPNLKAGRIRSLVHYFLDDDTEQNDTVSLVYRKSLLYLVSRAFQDKSEVVPLMGMQKYWGTQTHARVTSFNTRDNPDRTGSRTHGGFDNDLRTMNQILKVILGGNPDRPFAKADLEGY